MMVFGCKTDSGLVQSCGRVTGPNFCQFLELTKQGCLEPVFLKWALFTISGLQEVPPFDILLSYRSGNHVLRTRHVQSLG